MSQKRKQIIGFGTFNTPAEPEKETRVNYVELALNEYLNEFKPYDPGDEDNPQEFKTSREIQEEISSMVIASVSTITEYMVEHGYQMVRVEGGGLAWYMQSSPLF